MESFLDLLIESGGAAADSYSMLGTVTALVMAAVMGGILALIYDWTYTGKRLNRAQFSYTLVLLCLGGSLVWLIVADNLARAFGLAGALALIRYRTRMRDPKDTTMVFFAMVVGMACGLHQYFNAIFGTFFIGLVLSLIHLVNRMPTMRAINGGPKKRKVAKELGTGDTEGAVEAGDESVMK